MAQTKLIIVKPKMSYEDEPIIPPPSSMTVIGKGPLLYNHEGIPLGRKVGF